MRQADVFLESEGDNWLERNRRHLGVQDPVSESIELLKLTPKRVLEVGCADGWRLAKLRAKHHCEVFGVEPSRQACMEAAEKRIPVVQSTAAVPAVQGPFDLVIYGFCLYLADPAEWLRIAAEGDVLLAPGGHMIVHDFIAAEDEVYARLYQHRDGLRSFHFDFSKLWLAHPLYQMVSRRLADAETMITVMHKSGIDNIKVMR